MSELRRLASTLFALALGVALAACRADEEVAVEAPRPVRVVTVEPGTGGETVSLTGTVQAETEVNLAFRVDGRMLERFVNVGDVLTAGQRVARLDPQNEENAVQAARAAVAAARGQLVEASNNYERQRGLLAQGFTARRVYDQALQQRNTAQANLDAARAQLDTVENRLGWTQLEADAPGVVTATGAEPGEVVSAGRMVVQVAREDGRDAVFDVPARVKEQASGQKAEITVALQSDPAVAALGRVREVSPRADPITGTFQVRVGLADPPDAMRLGSTVVGRMRLGGSGAIELPASALTRSEGKPAVWIVDPASQTVALRGIEVAGFDPARVVVAAGLEPGELVVIAGVQALRPGQEVRLLGSAP